MFLFNKEAILGEWGAALKERAKLRYFSRLSAADKEIEPSVPTLFGEPQPLDNKKEGTAGKRSTALNLLETVTQTMILD